MIWLAICWILTVLLPLHGAYFLGARRERKKTKALLLMYWKLRNGKRPL